MNADRRTAPCSGSPRFGLSACISVSRRFPSVPLLFPLCGPLRLFAPLRLRFGPGSVLRKDLRRDVAAGDTDLVAPRPAEVDVEVGIEPHPAVGIAVDLEHPTLEVRI